jgi:predicted nucleic acid-binding Zn ribbon protein
MLVAGRFADSAVVVLERPRRLQLGRKRNEAAAILFMLIITLMFTLFRRVT